MRRRSEWPHATRKKTEEEKTIGNEKECTALCPCLKKVRGLLLGEKQLHCCSFQHAVLKCKKFRVNFVSVC